MHVHSTPAAKSQADLSPIYLSDEPNEHEFVTFTHKYILLGATITADLTDDLDMQSPYVPRFGKLTGGGRIHGLLLLLPLGIRRSWWYRRQSYS